jgi:hypothetical protein
MPTFSSSKIFHCNISDLNPILLEVAEHFDKKGYDTMITTTESGGYMLSISKGGMFKSIFGLRTALNVTLEPIAGAIQAKASGGLWGTQTVPALIMLFVAWPVLLTQIWGLIQRSSLDDEALLCVEAAIRARESSR